MISKLMTKYAALAMGIIMFSLFVFSDTSKQLWNTYASRYTPSPCKVSKDRIDPKMPKFWSTACPYWDVLEVTIDKSELPSSGNLRVILYKEMANSLSKLAFYGNPETVELLKQVNLTMKHKDLEIRGMTDGESLNKFLKLKEQNDILTHLKATVKVQEKKN